MNAKKMKKISILLVVLSFILIILFLITNFNKKLFNDDINTIEISYYPAFDFETGEKNNVVNKEILKLKGEEVKEFSSYLKQYAKVSDKKCQSNINGVVLLDNDYKLFFGNYCGRLQNLKNNKEVNIQMDEKLYNLFSDIIEKNDQNIYKNFSDFSNENISFERNGIIVNVPTLDDKEAIINSVEYINLNKEYDFSKSLPWYVINIGDSIKIYYYNNKYYGYYTDFNGNHFVHFNINRYSLDSIYNKCVEENPDISDDNKINMDGTKE